MKKIIILMTLSFASKAQMQFFKGIGFFVSATESAHFYDNKDEDLRTFSIAHYTANPEYYYPQSHISREYFNVISGGLFAEFSTGDRWIWRTEAEYIKKGAREKRTNQRV